ncbi:MAG: hypothetical protein WC485_06125 [Opitutaceae bacterium]
MNPWFIRRGGKISYDIRRLGKLIGHFPGPAPEHNRRDKTILLFHHESAAKMPWPNRSNLDQALVAIFPHAAAM